MTQDTVTASDAHAKCLAPDRGPLDYTESIVIPSFKSLRVCWKLI